MQTCACGCEKVVRGKWHQGHNRRGVPPTNKRGYTISNGYRYIYSPGHPDAHPKTCYVEEHRLVMEAVIGRILRRNEVVHHKNGDRADNRPHNLQLMTKREHDRLTTLVSEICLHEGCGQPHRARGLCSIHYGRYYRRHIPMPLLATRRSRWNRRSNSIC